MASYNHSYSGSFTSISSILRDQTELELHPIRVATERANEEAAQAIAEFQSNTVKNQLKQAERSDRESRKQTYFNNLKLIAAASPDDPMIPILESENAEILGELS